MADASALPRRIVKETQRLLSEPGPCHATRSVAASLRSKLSPPAIPSRLQLRVSVPRPTQTTCATSTSSSRDHMDLRMRVRCARRGRDCVVASAERAQEGDKCPDMQVASSNSSSSCPKSTQWRRRRSAS
eukprot:scaffold7841_cov128-Isochrysis_galbana.AAC.10